MNGSNGEKAQALRALDLSLIKEIQNRKDMFDIHAHDAACTGFEFELRARHAREAARVLDAIDDLYETRVRNAADLKLLLATEG